MDRVQKRCFAASLTLHGVLAGVVLFGSAFFTARQREESIPVLTFIPLIATDGQFAGGGNRSAGTPAPTPPANRPQPQPQQPVPRQSNPPQPQPAPPRETVREQPRAPAREPDPVRPIDKRVVQPVVEARTQPRVRLPESALQPVDRSGRKSNDRKPVRPATTGTTRSSESPSSSASSERNQLATRIQDSLNRIGSGTAGSTSVEMPGDGSGGPSYAPYAAIIRAIYMEAWQKPEDLHDGSAITEVEIDVAKDGSVISHRIVEPSGNARVDRSVQDALNRVRFIKEFPASWREERRTFQIRFDLKVKEQLLG